MTTNTNQPTHTSSQGHKRSNRSRITTIAAAALGLTMTLPMTACLDVQVGMSDNPKMWTTKNVVDCSFDGAADLVNKPTCYEIAVPEDWSNPDDDDQVVLSVAVFSATDTDTNADNESAKAAPLIYLEGGPGAQTLSRLVDFEPLLVDPYIAKRDVIVFDQRGVGTSTPSLVCDEEVEFTFADLKGDIPDDEIPAKSLAATQACHDRLQADGVNLAAYNSVASAQDINAMRIALGYDQLNVWGTSYGTRLAQTAMRMFPDTIRSAVLDSVEPVGANLDEDIAGSAQQAIQKILDACTDDAACAETYPNFEADFFALLDQLDETPATVEITAEDGTSFSSEITGEDLLALVFMSAYDKAGFSAVPAMVEQTRDGDYTLLQGIANITVDFGTSISSGMYHSVVCNEEVPFESAEAVAASVPSEGKFSRLSAINESPTVFEICEIWQAGEAPEVESEPVKSDIPTLVLTGSFDPITPPSYARSVAENLSQAYVFEFPTEGHGVSPSECGAIIVSGFLDDPTQAPDASCIDDVEAPKWTPDPVTLVPFEMTEPFSLSGVRPDGWQDDGMGGFYRVANFADQTALVMQPTGGRTNDEVLAGLGGTFSPAEATNVDGASWETYDGVLNGTVPVRIMFSPDNEFMVLFGSQAGEIDELFDSVAIPAAASLKAS